MGHNGRKPRLRAHGEIVCALDLGSSKIACFIARVDEVGRARIIGIGHQVSQGVRGGAIVDMEAAAQAVGAAVTAAEKAAGETVRRAVVNLSSGHPASQGAWLEVPVGGQEVGEGDLRRIMRAHSQIAVAPDSEIVHAIPVGYAIDGMRGIRDPRGMFGNALGVDLHLVTATTAALRNLSACLGRCHLEIEQVVVAPYAAGLAALVEDERQLGGTVIDLGGGTTSMAVFVDGTMVMSDCIPLGGSHVTSDVARGLTTPLAYAERLKTLTGSCVDGVADDGEMIEVPQVGEEAPGRTRPVAKSLLTGIIRPRLEEIFELVRSRLEVSGFAQASGRRVVLTGGGSQLAGVRELAAKVLDKQVRLGRPAALPGVADVTSGPAFATTTGLVAFALEQPPEAALAPVGEEMTPGTGLFSRLGGWLRDL